MEAVFVKNQIPIELTRIPFVESSFNTRAISKVGASGVWQFIRSTGKEFLQVNEAIDERNDPVRSAEAAAKLLKINYDSLGSWALAVTAYNHGRIGLLKMVRQAGSEDLEYLVDNVRARNFGFSSKNYFISILAALEVEQNYKKYYGDIDRKRSTLNFEVKLPSAIKLKDLCAFMGYSVRELIHLNPAWTDKTQTSQLRIPEGSMLRLPLKGDGTMASQESAKRVFAAGFVKIPKRFKK
jgi:membrane-bound lytic murein transglycosylase D